MRKQDKTEPRKKIIETASVTKPNPERISANKPSMDDIEKRLLEEQNKRLEAELECLRIGKYCEVYKSETTGYRWVIGCTIAIMSILVTVLIFLGAYNFIKSRQYKRNAEEELKEVHLIKSEAQTIYKNLEVDFRKQTEELVKTEITKIKEESEKQREITKLWNNASNDHTNRDYKSASEKWEKIINLLGNNDFEYKPSDAYCNWGTSLLDLAMQNSDEQLCKSSIEKFEKAAQLDPQKAVYYDHWGTALLNLAIHNSDEQLCRSSIEKHEKAVQLNPKEADYYFHWGLALLKLAMQNSNEQSFKSSIEKFEKAAQLNPDDADYYYNWGVSLSFLAKLKPNEQLYRLSIEKFKKAVQLNPNIANYYSNWGNALSDLAKQNSDEQLYKSSFEKYEKAIQLSPDNAIYYHNYGFSLLELSYFKTGKERNNILEYAKQNIQKAIDLGYDKALYNMACCYSLMKDSENCRKWLEEAKGVGDINSKEKLEKDKDFNNVREEQWFKDFIDSLD